MTNQMRKDLFDYVSGEDYHALNQRAKINQAKSIGAYSITTADGTMYNYSLTVYNYETVKYSEYTKSNGDKQKQISVEPDKYVTNWLLTSIIGPDYFDVNNNGPDEQDYGYWVEFIYGQFSDGYQWKFPYLEADESKYDWNLEVTSKSKTIGRKDIYYLNSIKTKSHTAFFVKDARTDGLGSDDEMEYGYTTSVNNGDFLTYTNNNVRIKTENNQNHKVLKLSKIILMDNQDVGLISMNTGALASYTPQTDLDYLSFSIFAGTSSSPVMVEDYSSTKSIYQMDNILDEADISSNYSTIAGKALKIIELDQGYTLAQNCENCANGKLTLNEVKMKTRGGHMIMPSYKFAYNLGNFDEALISSEYIDLENPGETNVKVKKDTWGYYAGNSTNHVPQEGSLREIETPTGAKIIVNYEEDDYQDEYALVNEVEYPVHGFYPTSNVSNVFCPSFLFVTKGFSSLPEDYNLELSKPLSSAFNTGDNIEVLIQISQLNSENAWNYFGGASAGCTEQLMYKLECEDNESYCNGIDFMETTSASILSISPNRRFVRVKFTEDVATKEKILDNCQAVVGNKAIARSTMFEYWNVKIKAHTNNGNIKGGGLRVGDIQMVENGTMVSKIEYDYSDASNENFNFRLYVV